MPRGYHGLYGIVRCLLSCCMRLTASRALAHGFRLRGARCRTRQSRVGGIADGGGTGLHPLGLRRRHRAQPHAAAAHPRQRADDRGDRLVLDRGRRRLIGQRLLSEPPGSDAEAAVSRDRDPGPQSRRRRRGGSRHAGPLRPRRDRRKSGPRALAGRQQRRHARPCAVHAGGADPHRDRAAEENRGRHRAGRPAIHDRDPEARGRACRWSS